MIMQTFSSFLLSQGYHKEVECLRSKIALIAGDYGRTETRKALRGPFVNIRSTKVT